MFLIKYAIRSIKRNSRRSFTLILGMVIALSTISGVLFYLDSTTSNLVQNSVAGVEIDVSVFGANNNDTTLYEAKNYISTNFSDIVLAADMIAGLAPLSGRSGGVIASPTDNFTLDFYDYIKGTANYTSTIIYGVEPDYLKDFDIFNVDSETLQNIDQLFSEGKVLISYDLAVAVDFSDTLNVSIVEGSSTTSESGGRITTFSITTSVNLSVGGIIEYDTAVVQDSINAFYQSTDDTSRITQSSSFLSVNCIVMSYDQLIQLINETETLLFNAVHVKVDHTKLGTTTGDVYAQVAPITDKVSIYFPELTTVNLLTLALDQLEEQLNQMSLFLIYFSLPGLILGGYVTKYAMDISIEERSREIGILRTKAAKRKSIAKIILYESAILSLLGLLLGIGMGYLIGLLISYWIGGGVSTGPLITVSMRSLSYSLGIGVTIAILSAILTTRKILSPSISEAVKSGNIQKKPLWRKFYLDLVMLGVVGIVSVLKYFDFNPIPDFAATTYNMLAPLLTWLGVTLLLVRLLKNIFLSLSSVIYSVYTFIFKDLGKIITKNVIYRAENISKITIILALTLSFGFTIAIVDSTYTTGVTNDLYYQVGSDLRIQFPNSDYLTYNTSTFQELFLQEFGDYVEAQTMVYSSVLRFGRTSVTLVGIDVNTFFDVVNMEDYYLQNYDAEQIKDILSTNDGINGSYYNAIFSNALANPSLDTTTTTSGGKGGKTTSELTTTTFSVGEEVPFTSQSLTITVKIADIANYFPFVANVMGLPEDQAKYAVLNAEFLKTPDPNNPEISLLDDYNASLMLINVKDNVDLDWFKQQITDWYDKQFSIAVDLTITTTTDLQNTYSSLINALKGLVSLEYILVLGVTFLSLQIFLTYSVIKRKKEFGTYFGIGASSKDVNKIILGEVFISSLFSLVTGAILSGLLAVMYLDFISSLLITQVTSISIPWTGVGILAGFSIISTLLTIPSTGRKLSKIDPVSIMRVM